MNQIKGPRVEVQIIHIIWDIFISLSSFLWLYYSGCMHNFINLNCIMQLKQFYNIAIKLVAEKSATAFGDLPDC